MMKTLRSLALLLFAMPAFAGLVVNGTFDSNCAGWALAQTDGFTCSSTEGNPGFALVLNNGPGPVPQASQSIAGLQIGDIYQITIDGKTHYNCCNDNTIPGAGVGIDGRQFDFLIVNGQPWTTYTFNFTYGGGSNLLVISAQRNGTDSDGEFDNVDINLIGSAGSAPEPGTLTMLGAGVALIIGSRLRRI
jgi:hypothetical protein